MHGGDLARVKKQKIVDLDGDGLETMLVRQWLLDKFICPSHSPFTVRGIDGGAMMMIVLTARTLGRFSINTK